jgi:hypothetical protein
MNVQELLVQSLAGGATAALILAALAWLYPRLKREQGYPFEAQIEGVVLPLVHQAVSSVYELTIKALKETGRELDTVDKQNIAADVYRLLPGWVKRFVSQEEFAGWVQAAYDDGRSFMLQFEGHFAAAYERWRAEAQDGTVAGEGVPAGG